MKKYRLVVMCFIIIIFLIFGLYFQPNILLNKKDNMNKIMYVADINSTVKLLNNKFNEVGDIYRGSKVTTDGKVLNDKNKNSYYKINYEGKTFYINLNNLSNDKKGAVKEEKVYVRTPASLYASLDTGKISSLVKKGEELEVLDFDKIDNKGEVNAYKIKYGDIEGYVYKKYVLTNKDEALKNYEPDIYYNVHNDRGDRFGGGHAGNLDYYPVDKPSFKDNVMPDMIYALYLNNSPSVIENIDSFIEYAKTTNINAFVVDIKDNESPGYKSKVFEQFSPTNYQYANNSFESYQSTIKKLKDAGFYVIGRITVFKDKYYSLDNPNNAIMDTRTGNPYLHSDTYWPSPYQRAVWEFNVSLAKEAVSEMGFNEIQFDYVRFPDKTISAEKSGIMDFRNTYGEEKAQAIQRFLMYATDEIHKLHAYVSADVFGESAYTYVTAYGQYWAAISNVVDVISGMPYPDHFNKYEFGLTEPVWTIPYDLLNLWGSKYVMVRQTEIPTPAIVRTWVAVYDAKGGSYPYGINEIDAEIRGLFDAGLTGGYMTWLSYSSLDRYKSQKEIYDKEY